MFSLNSFLIFMGLVRSHLKRLNAQICGKLGPRALKCVFIVFWPTKKRYKCYHPSFKNISFLWMCHFCWNHLFTNPHLQYELSFNEDEANLNLPNLSNSFFIAPSVVIEFTPTKVGTSELENVNEKNGSITIVPLRVYSRRRLLNCVSMQTQEFEFVVGAKLTLDILLCHWCLKT